MSTTADSTLKLFVQSLNKVSDLRSKHGQLHSFRTLLALLVLGLLAIEDGSMG